MFELCEKITKEINKKIKKLDSKRASKVIQIGADQQPTRKLDKIAENIALKHLKKENKDFLIISEEIGKKRIGKNPNYKFIIDPIDGTHNAIKNVPLYSTSIAILNKKNQIIFSYIKHYEENSIYYTKDQNSYKNDTKIETSDMKKLSKSSISFYHDNSLNYKKFSDKFKHIRRLGCISLELCYVASGKLDAFIDLRGAGIIDIAAGIKLIENAGGFYKTLNKSFPTEEIEKSIKTIASNKWLKNPILEVLEYD